MVTALPTHVRHRRTQPPVLPLAAAGHGPELDAPGDAIYVRFHGAKQWYRHDYSDAELEAWAGRLRASRAKGIWAYFNNDFQGCAFRNAQTLNRLLR
jgi:uncharacterized protein YecE (DUF72 family)